MNTVMVPQVPPTKYKVSEVVQFCVDMVHSAFLGVVASSGYGLYLICARGVFRADCPGVVYLPDYDHITCTVYKWVDVDISVR